MASIENSLCGTVGGSATGEKGGRPAADRTVGGSPTEEAGDETGGSPTEETCDETGGSAAEETGGRPAADRTVGGSPTEEAGDEIGGSATGEKGGRPAADRTASPKVVRVNDFLYEFPDVMNVVEGRFYTAARERNIHHCHLPHWAADSTLIFLTYRLGDSLPDHLLAMWREERDDWIRTHPQPWDAATTMEYYDIFPEKIQSLIDAGHGSCVLARKDCRDIVAENLMRFNGDRYFLHSFVVMPNHVHILMEIRRKESLAKIVWGWKSYTAKRINEVIGSKGGLWRREYYDRLVRNDVHYKRVVDYIRRNARIADMLVASGKIYCMGRGGTVGGRPAADRTVGGSPTEE